MSYRSLGSQQHLLLVLLDPLLEVAVRKERLLEVSLLAAALYAPPKPEVSPLDAGTIPSAARPSLHVPCK